MVDYRFHKNILLINPAGGYHDINEISNLIDEIKPESHVILWQPWEAHDERFVNYINHDYSDNSNHSEDYQKFEDVLIKNNVKFYLLLGCDYNNGYSNIKTNPIKNFEVLFWPTALLHYTFYGMVNFYGKPPSELFNPHRPIDKLYLNLNNLDRQHRALLLDNLCKFDLFDYGINTWQHLGSKVWDFKYFNPQRLNFDGFYDKVDHIIQRIFSKKLLNAPNLIDIVGETYPHFNYNHDFPELTNELIFHTEKTFKSILFGKPFLVLGAKGQNVNLSKYGFELYSQIFDYEFDKANFMSSRCFGIIDNLYATKNKNFGEVRDYVIDVSRGNINRADEITYNDEYIPIQLKKLIEENKDEYKILLRDFDTIYAATMLLPHKWSLIDKVFKEIYQ